MAKETIIIRDEALRGRVLKLIAALDLKRSWEITVEQYRKRRTNSQLRLMFMWIDRVVEHVHEHTGTDKETIHRHFKKMFLPASYSEFGSEIIEYYTTKGRTTKEMSEYMNKIFAWCAAEGIFLPVPEDLGRNRAA